MFAAKRGHILMLAIVMITLLSLMLAMAVEPANTAATRQKERELVYRGEHLAAGIKRFYVKFGRFPYELEELIEEEPRFIRQLYKDPMTSDGEWNLVFLSATDQLAVKDLNKSLRNVLNQTLNPDQPVVEDTELNSENIAQKNHLLFDSPKQQITGLRSKAEKQGLLVRDDSSLYSDWLFSALPKPKVGLGEVINQLKNAPGEKP